MFVNIMKDARRDGLILSLGLTIRVRVVNGCRLSSCNNYVAYGLSKIGDERRAIT